MNIQKLYTKIEELSEEVHNAWMKEKLEQGFHAPRQCPESSEHDKAIGKFSKFCDKCHTDLYPYSELPENIKEYDRVTVRAVLGAIEKTQEFMASIGKAFNDAFEDQDNENHEMVKKIIEETKK